MGRGGAVASSFTVRGDSAQLWEEMLTQGSALDLQHWAEALRKPDQEIPHQLSGQTVLGHSLSVVTNIQRCLRLM